MFGALHKLNDLLYLEFAISEMNLLNGANLKFMRF